MAIALNDSHAGGYDGANDGSPTWSVTLGSTTSGRVIVAAVATLNVDGNWLSGLDCDGNAMSEDTGARVISGDNQWRCQVFWINDESATGSTNFDGTISTDSVLNYSSLHVFELTGADTTAPIGADAEDTATSGTDHTYTLTTTTADSFIICTGHFSSSGAISPTTGITEEQETAFASLTHWSGSRSATSATGYTVGCTSTDSVSVAVSTAVEILEAAATEDELEADGIKSAATVGSPTAAHIHDLGADGIKSAATVGAPDIGQEHALDAGGIESNPTVGAGTLGQEHALDAGGIKSAATIGGPSISESNYLEGAGIESNPTVGAPVIAQEHALTGDGIKSAATTGAATIAQEHALSADGIKSAATVGSPTATHVNDLAADGIESTLTVGAPDMGVISVIEADGIKSALTIGAPTIAQVHALLADGVKSALTIEAPELGGEASLTASGIAVSPTVGAPYLSGPGLQPAARHVHQVFGTEDGDANPTLSVNLSSDTSGRLLVLFVSSYKDAEGAPQIGDTFVDSVEATLIEDVGLATGGPSYDHRAFWVEDTTNTGATDIDVTIATGYSTLSVTVFEVFGADLGDPIGADEEHWFAAPTFNDGFYSITTTRVNSLLLTGALAETGPFDAAPGFSVRYDTPGNDDDRHYAASRPVTSVGSYTVGVDDNDTELGVSLTVEILAPVGLLADGIKSTVTVGAPDFVGVSGLTASGIESNATIGAPTIEAFFALLADGIKSASTAGAPSIAQIHALLSGGIQSAVTVGNPIVSQDQELTADGIMTTITVGAPLAGLLGVWFGVDPESESWTVTTPGSEGWTVLTPGAETWTAEE